MSYQPGTVLTRKEPYGTAEEPHALDVVRVVCPSPLNNTGVAEWEGTAGDAVIVEPVAVFGPSEVMPTIIGNQQYEITSYPEDAPQQRIDIPDNPRAAAMAQLTPEEQFAKAAAAAAKGKPVKGSSTRERTTIGGAA